MNAYRDPAPQTTSETSLSYDYAAALDRRRRSVALNALHIIVALVGIFGLYPFVAWFGSAGILIGLSAYAFIGVPLAIRRAQSSSTVEIEAYEDRLLRKRSRKKRH